MNEVKKSRLGRKYLRYFIAGIILIAGIGLFYIYLNFNKLLSDALIKSFNSNTISDVYEIRFKNLNVNPFKGSITVKHVEIIPREKPLKDYPYINSSFQLKTRKIELINVEIMTLLKQNKLKLERIRIAEPDLEFMITDNIPTFIPFNQKQNDSIPKQDQNKNFITGFFLKEFSLENASFHVLNTAKQRNIRVIDFDFLLKDLQMDQTPGKDVISYNLIKMNIGEINGSLKNEALKYISLKNYNLTIDQLKIQKSVDTLIYHFDDFQLGLEMLDFHTSDSIFHVTLDMFNLSYKNKSLQLNGISFKPNISEDELQKRYEYQNTQFSGTVGNLSITGINFDSYVYKKTLLIDKVSLDSVDAFVYKDKTKPMNMKKFPQYFGQTFKAIPFPILVKEVIANNVQLTNKERKEDGSTALAHLKRASFFAGNITNLSDNLPFTMKADAWLEDQAHFIAELNFDYKKPQFKMDARFDQFDLTYLNKLIQSYTPASVVSGTVNQLSFSGTAFQTNASGTMTFLYNNLKVDLQLKEKAKWKSSLLAFAANEVVNSANPVSETTPPKIVKYQIERDMNKGFVNVIIKSALNGLKETIIMSKENKKAYKEAKKRAKKDASSE
jgi:hypothetical protein